jgi:hypothetical protein
MHVPKGTRWVLTAAIAAVSAISVAYVDARARDQTPASPPVDAIRPAFSADVTIQHAQVSADGRPLAGAPPAMSFHLEQKPGPRGRVLTMTLTGVERRTASGVGGLRELDMPQLAARMAHDADGLRLYDRHGTRIRAHETFDRAIFNKASDALLPSPPDYRETAASGGGESWFDGVLVRRDAAAERRRRLERLHGPSRDSVRGLERYVSAQGANEIEVLVDPETALPVETNAARGGSLSARAQMSYDVHPTGLIVRRLLQSERVARLTDRRRLVTRIELSNVRMTGGGGQ